MFAKYKKIIIGVLVLILAFVIYTIFFKTDPESDNLVQSSNPRQIDALGEEIIRSLSKIQSLELDQSVFSDPIYLRLVDDTEDIPEPSVGKQNPFEPLPQESASSEINLSNNSGESNNPQF